MNNRPLIYDMRVECAWCGKLLRMSKCVKPGQISHGICEECKERVLSESVEYQAVKGRENESVAITA